MINFIIKNNNPKILVISPLKEGDIISSKTYSSVIQNTISIHWISFEGSGNPYKNFDIALKEYQKQYPTPDYIIKMDNDIICKNNMLDNMQKVLKSSHEHIAYTYCAFKFVGNINVSFKAESFNIDKLLQQNYISSISMMKSKCLEQIGGVVTDDKYFRLLDWALWLKFLYQGKIGVPCKTTSFVAYASKNSISARSNEDYIKKASHIINDFVMPIKNKLKISTNRTKT